MKLCQFCKIPIESWQVVCPYCCEVQAEPENQNAEHLDLTDRSSLMRSLPHGLVVAEIGVQRGIFSEVILRENQPRELYLIDCWCSRPGTEYARLDFRTDQWDHAAALAEVRAKFAAHANVHIVQAFSLYAACNGNIPAMDIVYLDGDHTRPGIQSDMAAWWECIKPGGWLTGHDYTMLDWVHVREVVDAFVAEHGLTLFVTREPDLPSWAVRKAF